MGPKLAFFLLTVCMFVDNGCFCLAFVALEQDFLELRNNAGCEGHTGAPLLLPGTVSSF